MTFLRALNMGLTAAAVLTLGHAVAFVALVRPDIIAVIILGASALVAVWAALWMGLDD